jgi:hypothetical protein
MSHFTNLKTSFKDLFHLEIALNKLKINYKKEKKLIDSVDTKSLPSKSNYNINLVIETSNDYDVTFTWNGEEYELVFDASFWSQPYSVETFISKITLQYANSVIITEGEKVGFSPVKLKNNVDGSKTITLVRWTKANLQSVV